MSQFQPITTERDLPDESDELGGSLLHALSRFIPHAKIPSLLVGVFQALVTFGVAPLVLWAQRFATTIRAERHQLAHLAEWLRLHTGRPEAQRLQQAAEQIRVRRGVYLFAAVSAGAAVLALLPAIGDFDLLLGATVLRRLPPGFIDPDQADRIFAPWTVGLAGAYAAHWFQVRLHAAAMARYIEELNPLLTAEGMEPVASRSPGLGFRPTWLIGAVLLAWAGLWWGVALMLAGAVHRRYANVAGPGMRRPMAQRLQQLILKHRPWMEQMVPVRLLNRCGRLMCQRELPAGAKFCPRCGWAVPQEAITNA